MYCEKCHRIVEALRCPVCGKKLREPQPDDFCFLVEKESLWAGMLQDVLTQNEIPFITKGVLGAALALKVGELSERSQFYVPYAALDKGHALVEELFSLPEDGAEIQNK